MLSACDEIYRPLAVFPLQAGRLRVRVQHENAKVHAPTTVRKRAAVSRQNTWVHAVVLPVHAALRAFVVLLRDPLLPNDIIEERVPASGARVRIPYQGKYCVVSQVLGNFLGGHVVWDIFQARRLAFVLLHFAISKVVHESGTCMPRGHAQRLTLDERRHRYDAVCSAGPLHVDSLLIPMVGRKVLL